MTSALDITQAVKPPRAVFVNFPLGHQTGPPDQPELQRKIVTDAMRAFETIKSPGTIVELPYVWDKNDHQGLDAQPPKPRSRRRTRSRAPKKIQTRLSRVAIKAL